MTLSEIYPVIVLYRCWLADALSYQSLIAQNAFTAFMVYDNSPADYVVDETALPPTATYHRDLENGGLSKAYNMAAQRAQELGYRYLLILDQDTHFPADALTHYLEVPQDVELCVPMMRTTNNVAFSPVKVRGWNLRGANLSAQAFYDLYQYNPVNSGTCVKISSFLQAGGYKTAVRLDYADFCFFKRLRKVVARFYLLPFVATQDFSNDEVQVPKLLQRLSLYLESAAHCDNFTWGEHLRFHYQVLRHCCAIAVKTRSCSPLFLYLQKFLFARK